MVKIEGKYSRVITTLVVLISSLIFVPFQMANLANAGESVSLTTISGSWDPSYVSGVAELGYIGSSNSDIYQVDFVLKQSPAGSAVNIQLINSSAKNASLKNLSNSSTLVIPNIAQSEQISSYVKIQICDIKNGCAGQISSLGTYVVTAIATSTNGTKNTADIIMNVQASAPTPTPTPTAISDTEKPKVDWQTSGISNTKVAYGEEVSAWVRITDNVGVDDVTAYLYANNPISGPIGAAISKKTCKLSKGGIKDGIWLCESLKVTEKQSKDDQYSIGFDARDGAGNTILGQAIGSIYVMALTPTPTPSNLTPTTVVIEAPTQVTLNSNGEAFVQIMAFVQPVDINKLPPGRSSLDVDLIFKGSYGTGCTQQPAQTIGTYKEGYKFFFLKYTLSSTGSCTGTFQFYGDLVYEKTNYPTFTFNVLPYVNLGEISISDISLYSQSVAPGGTATIYYWVKNPKLQGTAGLGAGIGDFGVDPGPFGDEYSSIGWTLGVVKGDATNGLYKSNISIPSTAKPGTYKTWVFWKGITGPVYGPDITIVGSDTDQSDALKNFSTWVQDAQAFYSNLVIQAVNAKLGDGGYRYITLRPDPKNDYYKYPSIEKFGLYKAELSKWADYEISNIRIDNFIKSDSNSPSRSDLQMDCENKSAMVTKSLKESDVQLSDLNRRISNFKSLDSEERQIEYNSITLSLKAISGNLNTYIIKLPVYLSSNSDCSDFSKQLTYANALYSTLKSFSVELNKLAIESPSSSTYINFTFTRNNQSLTGENLYLDGIDSTGFGRGSIEINAFLKAYDPKLMFGNQSLNFQINATTSTPRICKISSPKFFLGTDNSFTKFSLTPLSEGECLLNFIGVISGRKDLLPSSTTWVTNVRASATSTGKDISTELNSDGLELDPMVNLSVTKLSNGKFSIKVDSNLESEDVEIFASKKGFKTIKFSANTGASTQLKITTTRNLKGYTLVIKYNGDVLDKFVVK